MLIVYTSRTGNVSRFVRKLPFSSIDIKDVTNIDQPFIFISYTTGFGQAPLPAITFLDQHQDLLRGVASSGHRNWGQRFGKAADVLSERYGVPIIHKFELQGREEDVTQFIHSTKALEEILQSVAGL